MSPAKFDCRNLLAEVRARLAAARTAYVRVKTPTNPAPDWVLHKQNAPGAASGPDTFITVGEGTA